MRNIKQFKKRADYEQLLMEVLNPLKPFYSNEKAYIYLGDTSAHYEDKTAGFEAFSRILWGLVPMLFGNSKESEFEEIYRKGLAAGTNKESKEYWGECRDYDQRLVEMAAISYGLLLIPDKLWKPLSENEKSNLADWLNQINDKECYKCNWQFFNVLVNIALKKLDCEYSQMQLNENLNKIESYYRNDGWYTDGDTEQKDYYISFAMQFYGIVYANYMKEEDPDRCERFISRAHLFAKEFIYWFAEDGSSIPYGRSLTYRFAQVSFFSICAAFKILVLPMPVIKGIIIRHLENWFSSPIFDKAGILTIGYKYPNLIMSEDYNAPGSPYWGLKAFAFLMLDESDEFWTIEPEELPELDNLKLIADNGMIIRRGNDNVTAFVSGKDIAHVHTHTEEKYQKLTYSTKYGFSISKSQKTLSEAAPDCGLSFELLSHIYVKNGAYSSYFHEDGLDIGWSPVKGIDIKTSITITEYGHIRTHTVESEYDCIAYDSGFSISIKDEKVIEKGCTKDYSFVKNDDTYCNIELQKGTGEGVLIYPSPNTNIIYSKIVIPAIKYQIKKGIQVISAYVFHA